MRSTSPKTRPARPLKLSRLKTHETVLAADLRVDREFRAEWRKSEVARAVALQVLRYRAAHRLTQATLARRLGMAQSAIARLELGEHTPSFDTLERLAERLDVEVLVHISPGRRKAKLVSDEAERTGVKATTPRGGRVLVAAS